MYYIVSLSGGTQSAVSAERALERYGAGKVWLAICDTKNEHDDLWRFHNDCVERWRKVYGVTRCHVFADGRDPYQLAEQKSLIPNQYLAPCSNDLKREVLLKWLWRVPKPVTVLLGYSWNEQHRIERRRHWHRQTGGKGWKRPSGYHFEVPGVYEDYPLAWEPWDMRECTAIVQSEWGIEPPLMNRLGFSHNNCGKYGCVKWGIEDSQRFAHFFPEQHEWRKQWEQRMRAKGGSLANRSFLRDQSGGTVTPMTLEELELRPRPDFNKPTQQDLFSCFCTY